MGRAAAVSTPPAEEDAGGPEPFCADSRRPLGRQAEEAPAALIKRAIATEQGLKRRPLSADMEVW